MRGGYTSRDTWTGAPDTLPGAAEAISTEDHLEPMSVTLTYSPEKIDHKPDGFAVTRTREGSDEQFVTFIPNAAVEKTYMRDGKRVLVVSDRAARRFALGVAR